MTWRISAIVAGTEYYLDDGTYCYFLGDDGLGMAPSHLLIERGPLQHGETVRDFRLDPRFFRLFLEIQGTDWDDLFTRRAALINIFKLAATPVKIRFAFSSFTRQIDAFFVGGMGMSSADRNPFNQVVTVDFEAPDPSLYDPSAILETFALGGGSDTFPVPMSVPHQVGASTIDQTKAVVYSGSVLTYPYLIRIWGPITDCVITNETTGEKLDFTGITISGGDYYDINLEYGSKTVEDSSGTDKIADLTDDSDLATWHIDPDPDAPGGSNSIRVEGNSITSTTKVEVNYYEKYVGQ